VVPCICERRFEADITARAASRALPSAGSRMPISSAMIAITTSNSISVNPRVLLVMTGLLR